MSEHLILGTFHSDMEYLYRLRYDFYGIDEDNEIEIFCERANISPSLLKSKSRKAEVVRYRRAFVNFSNKTQVCLANLLGLHHSSVGHLRKTHQDYLTFDKKYSYIWKTVDK